MRAWMGNKYTVIILMTISMILLPQVIKAGPVAEVEVEADNIAMVWLNPDTGKNVTYTLTDGQYKNLVKMTASGMRMNDAIRVIISKPDYKSAVASVKAKPAPKAN